MKFAFILTSVLIARTIAFPVEDSVESEPNQEEHDTNPVEVKDAATESFLENVSDVKSAAVESDVVTTESVYSAEKNADKETVSKSAEHVSSDVVEEELSIRASDSDLESAKVDYGLESDEKIATEEEEASVRAFEKESDRGLKTADGDLEVKSTISPATEQENIMQVAEADEVIRSTEVENFERSHESEEAVVRSPEKESDFGLNYAEDVEESLNSSVEDFKMNSRRFSDPEIIDSTVRSGHTIESTQGGELEAPESRSAFPENPHDRVISVSRTVHYQVPKVLSPFLNPKPLFPAFSDILPSIKAPKSSFSQFLPDVQLPKLSNILPFELTQKQANSHDSSERKSSKNAYPYQGPVNPQSTAAQNSPAIFDDKLYSKLSQATLQATNIVNQVPSNFNAGYFGFPSFPNMNYGF